MRQREGGPTEFVDVVFCQLLTDADCSAFIAQLDDTQMTIITRHP